MSSEFTADSSWCLHLEHRTFPHACVWQVQMVAFVRGTLPRIEEPPHSLERPIVEEATEP